MNSTSARGSRNVEEGNRFLTYRELADQLVRAPQAHPFHLHVELMPISEHPFDASWGYQPVGYFAPDGRGSAPPTTLRTSSIRCTATASACCLRTGSFRTSRCDIHGLGYFDGTHLYEHEDFRLGEHRDKTKIFNYGRPEAATSCSATPCSGLKALSHRRQNVDAAASMIDPDYSQRGRVGAEHFMEATRTWRRSTS